MDATSNPNRLVCHFRMACIVAIAVTFASLFGAASASAAVSAPTLVVSSVATPTNFVPGDAVGQYTYEVRIANVGAAPTDGSPITITDTLPAGLTVKKTEMKLRFNGNSIDFGGAFCESNEPAPVVTVTCTLPNELPGATDVPALLAPGEEQLVIIHVSPASTTEGEALTNHAAVQGGGAPPASVTFHNEASATEAPAGFAEFDASLTGLDGQPVSQAGSHPYIYTTSFSLNSRKRSPGPGFPPGGDFAPSGGDTKDIRIALPPGLVGNPTATGRCTLQQFNTTRTITPFPGFSFVNVLQNDCPDGSVVGFINLRHVDEPGNGPVPLYNLVPPPGKPALLGFQFVNLPFFIDTEVRTGGDYGIDGVLRNTSQAKRVITARATLWGTPGESRHDAIRGQCLNPVVARFPMTALGSCASGLEARPFLRLPTSCAGPLDATMSLNTWENPATFVSALSSAPTPTNCAPLDFGPTISLVPQTTVADSPSGLRVNLHLPQNDDPNLLATADLRNAVVTLPKGVTVNPAQASGLRACSPAQIELKGPKPAQCPDASKVGSVEVHTPLLDHPLKGAVHVATQNDNPFNSLLAIYIAVNDPETGVVVKLAGHVEPDPVTGQLTTTFNDNPQVPFEDFVVEFFDGPRAALRTPSTCGTYTTTTALKPWSAPESGPDATPSDFFTVATAPGGGPCAGSEAQQPHSPSFSAGTASPVAGAFSPFVMNLRREDGSQTLRGLNLKLPLGLSGKLAGIPYCPQASIDQAKGRSQPGEGAIEQAAPSCPVASQVGTVNVGAGVGPSPIYVGGKVYLAGPYKGAPLSAVVITPAVAGPFDLGTVVVRAALNVNPVTAQVSAVSDSLPTILEGIPLAVRSVSLAMDKPDFTLNPTNCEPTAVDGEVLSLVNQVARLSSRFQVGGCRGLDLKPRLYTRLIGGIRRGAHPKLRTVLMPRPGDANIRRAVVSLPRSEFLDQANIRTVCTRVQFAADSCPKGAIYGRVVAHTPLFDEPLRGPVYLRSSDNLLPDLVFDLRGQVDVEASARIDSNRGGIRATFRAIPDAPLSKVIVYMKGGRKQGLLVNSRNICARTYRSRANFVGQNGKVARMRPVLKNSKCNKRRKAKRSAHRSR